MEETNYYEFVEENDHEGERWSFYLLLTLSEVNKIIDALDLLDVLYDNFSPYDLNEKTCTKEQVDILVEHAYDGYMPSDTLVETINWSMIDTFLETKDIDDDPFYKGQCWF